MEGENLRDGREIKDKRKEKSATERDRDAVMGETFGNRETEEREMNECGGGIRGGQAAAMAAGGSVCLCVCGSGGKGSRLAGSSLRRSGPLIKSEGQTGGLPPSFSSPLHPSLPHSLSHSPAAGYSEALREVEGREEGEGGSRGADAESLAACGDCKPWLCGQTGDSNRQIRCFWTATLSLLCSLHSDSQRQLQPVGVCVVGGCSSGLGLELICVCVCAPFRVWF